MQKKIKVIHIIVDLGTGGAERQLIELLKKNSGHKLLILNNAGNFREELDFYKVNYKELNLDSSLSIFANLLKISEEIKVSKTTIIHTWMYNACFIITIVKLIFNLQHYLVWGIRCSNMDLNQYSLSLRLSVKLCRLVSFMSNGIIYNSHSGLAYHRSLGYSSKWDRVIYNGIDSKKFKFSKTSRSEIRKYLGIKKHERVIICVARVDPMKNHTELLKAFEKIRRSNKKAKLLLVGKKTEIFKEEKGVIALGIKLRVENYYSAADMIVLPSKFGEGFSNALAEGMLCELFPISTNVGDSVRLVGGIGEISKNFSAHGIFKSIKNALNINKSKINNLSKLARKRILTDFSVKKMSMEYDKCYKELN